MTPVEPMTQTERFEAAPLAHDPENALRGVVLELAAEGIAKTEISSRLENFLLDRRRREYHSESDENALLDVLDALSGGCHPTAQLLGKPG